MTYKVNTIVFDNGLSVFLGTGKLICITQGEPLVLADCTSLSGSGGKRVTDEYTVPDAAVTVVEGINDTARKVIIPYGLLNNGVRVAVDAGVADYWVVFYDATRILYQTDNLEARTFEVNDTILSPELSYEMRP